MNDRDRAIIAAYEAAPQWRRDQFDAALRNFMDAVERACEWVEKWEAAGIRAAEEHANGETR